MVFEQTRNRSEALQSDLGTPKGPPQGPPFFYEGPRGAVGARPICFTTPFDVFFLAQDWLNRASGATKCSLIQVKVFKTKKRFP